MRERERERDRREREREIKIEREREIKEREREREIKRERERDRYEREREKKKTKKSVKSVRRNGAFRPPKFNIFNISPVLSTFRKKHLTFPLFREGRLTKQGKC